MTYDPQDFAATLRRVADLIDKHPHIKPPIVSSAGGVSWHLYSWDCPDGIPAMVAAIRRAVGGKWDKAERAGCGDPEMVFTRDGYQIVVQREAVCTRRVVGTEVVTLPAQRAIEAQPERTETRDVIEWDCEPVLAAEVAS